MSAIPTTTNPEGTKMLAKRFSRQTIEEMLKFAEISRNLDKEVGFPLCSDNGTISRSTEITCIGNKCSVRPSRNCGQLERIGSFHTHSRKNQLFPSMDDIQQGYIEGLECIGNENTVMCIERKNEFHPEVLDDIYSAKKNKRKNHKEYLKNNFNITLFRRSPNSDKIQHTNYEF